MPHSGGDQGKINIPDLLLMGSGRRFFHKNFIFSMKIRPYFFPKEKNETASKTKES